MIATTVGKRKQIGQGEQMEAMQASKKLMKVEEVAERLNVAISTVYHWGHRGILTVVKINGATRYRAEDVEKLILDNLHASKTEAA